MLAQVRDEYPKAPTVNSDGTLLFNYTVDGHTCLLLQANITVLVQYEKSASKGKVSIFL